MTVHTHKQMCEALGGEPVAMPGDGKDLQELTPWPRIEEFAPLVEALEPLPDDERARVLLYCLLKYAPSEFSNGDLFGLIERARSPSNACNKPIQIDSTKMSEALRDELDKYAREHLDGR